MSAVTSRCHHCRRYAAVEGQRGLCQRCYLDGYTRSLYSASGQRLPDPPPRPAENDVVPRCEPDGDGRGRRRKGTRGGERIDEETGDDDMDTLDCDPITATGQGEGDGSAPPQAETTKPSSSPEAEAEERAARRRQKKRELARRYYAKKRAEAAATKKPAAASKAASVNGTSAALPEEEHSLLASLVRRRGKAAVLAVVAEMEAEARRVLGLEVA